MTGLHTSILSTKTSGMPTMLKVHSHMLLRVTLHSLGKSDRERVVIILT